MDYATATQILSTARGDSKPLANNTRLHKLASGAYAVRFHATDVVTIHADGTYTLATDGWYSKTTAERINTYSPARIVVKGGHWYIAREAQAFYPGPLRYERTAEWGERQPVTAHNRAYYSAVREWEAANLLPFADGVRVNANGHVIDGQHVPIEAPASTTASWDRERGDWSGPVTMAENKQRHAARIAALLAPRDAFPFTHEQPNGVRAYTMSNAMIRACDHYIMVPEHYRADGSCRCNDASDPNMEEWGYTWSETTGRWS